MLRRSICLPALLVFVFAPTFAFSADEVPAKPSVVDLSYVPADAFGIVVVQPRRLMAAPELQMIPLEVVTATLQKEAGLDPANIEQIVVVVDNPFQPRPPEPGLIFHLAQAVQPDKVFPPLTVGATEAQSGGKKYLKPRNEWQQGVYMPDGKTVVVAREEMLKRMMAAQPSVTSPLHQRAKALDLTAQVAAVFSLDAVRDSVKQMLATVPQLPPPLAEFPKLLELSSAYELRLTLKGTFRIETILHTTDAQSAPEIERIVNSALQFAQISLRLQMQQQFARSQDPIEQALGKYMQRMVTATFETIKVQRAGTDVSVSSEQNFGVASVGIGAALLMPAVAKVREAAQRTQSTNNVRQFLIAMLTYEAANNRLPARAKFSKDGKSLLSWRVLILPYIEEQVLYEQFHLDEPWDSEHNKPLIAKMPQIFASPDQPAGEGRTRYVVPVGKGTMFEGTEGLKMSQITDGTSNTVCLVEVAPDKAVIWTKPDDMDYNPEKPLAGFGAAPQRGFIVGFADAHVQTLRPSVDLDTLRAIFTASGGEPVDFDKLNQ